MTCGSDSSMAGSLYANDGCFQFVSRWLVMNGYKNPGQFIPESFAKVQDYRIQSRAVNQLVTLSNVIGKRLNLEKPMLWGSLRVGDIALLKVPFPKGPPVKGRQFYANAACYGIKHERDLWAMKTDTGLAFLPLTILEAWHIELKEV